MIEDETSLAYSTTQRNWCVSQNVTSRHVTGKNKLHNATAYWDWPTVTFKGRGYFEGVCWWQRIGIKSLKKSALPIFLMFCDAELHQCNYWLLHCLTLSASYIENQTFWKSHNWTFRLHEFFSLPSSLHEFFSCHFPLHEFFLVFPPPPPPPITFLMVHP